MKKYLLKTTICEYFCNELPEVRLITHEGIHLQLEVHGTKEEDDLIEFDIVFTPPYLIEALHGNRIGAIVKEWE